MSPHPMKRIFDLVVSSLLLIVLSPVMLAVAVTIYVKMGRPILFVQERGGFKGRTFNLYKFRTMYNSDDSAGELLPDHQRLGKFGSFLRSFSLDELPGLYCVLKGDMSLVGPRPFLSDYLVLYNDYQSQRHDVMPGITGWAQVQGRNSLSWDEKFELDVWYVKHCSMWLDMKILFLTVAKVFRRDGIATTGEVSGTRFHGNPK